MVGVLIILSHDADYGFVICSSVISELLYFFGSQMKRLSAKLSFPYVNPFFYNETIYLETKNITSHPLLYHLLGNHFRWAPLTTCRFLDEHFPAPEKFKPMALNM